MLSVNSLEGYEIVSRIEKEISEESLKNMKGNLAKQDDRKI